jgi:hypothetical protein
MREFRKDEGLLRERLDDGMNLHSLLSILTDEESLMFRFVAPADSKHKTATILFKSKGEYDAFMIMFVRHLSFDPELVSLLV